MKKVMPGQLRVNLMLLLCLRELYPGTTTKPQTKNVIGLKLYRRVFGIPAKKADKIQVNVKGNNSR